MKPHSIILFSLVALLSLPVLSQAATFTVTSSGDENAPDDSEVTLREAIAMANATLDSDTIVFDPELSGETINTATGYLILEDLIIDGVGAQNMRIQSTSENSLFKTASGKKFSLLNIDTAAGKRNLTGIYACGNVNVSSVSFRNFRPAISVCSKDSSVNVSKAYFKDNRTAISSSFVEPITSTISINVENSKLDSSGVYLSSKGGSSSLTIRDSQLTGDLYHIGVGGSATLNIDSSSITGSDRVSITSKSYRYREETYDPYQYYFPKLNINNSTIANNTWEYNHLIELENSTTSISHSTFYNNRFTGNAYGDNTTNGFLYAHTDKDEINQGFTGTLSIDHTVIANPINTPLRTAAIQTDLNISYSVTPYIQTTGDTGSFSMDSFSTIYQGASSSFEPIQSDLSNTPYLLPVANSFIINAGDPSSTAGTNGVPVTEQRGSDRIIGGKIDIGAVERNRVPELDIAALLEEYERQKQVLEEAGTPDQGIVVDLDDYITEPDGDSITAVSFTGPASLDFDSTTHVLSGAAENFRIGEMEVTMEESTGLVAVAVIDWRPSKKSSSSGGGAPSPALLLALALGLLRGRRIPGVRPHISQTKCGIPSLLPKPRLHP